MKLMCGLAGLADGCLGVVKSRRRVYSSTTAAKTHSEFFFALGVFARLKSIRKTKVETFHADDSTPSYQHLANEIMAPSPALYRFLVRTTEPRNARQTGFAAYGNREQMVLGDC